MLVASLLSAAFTSFPALSQTPPPPLSASVTLKNGKPQNYVLVGCDNANLRVTGEAGSGQASLPVDGIESVKIAPPTAYFWAHQAFEEGDYSKAEALMLPYVVRLTPYVNLPGTNAGSLLFEYGESLRNAGRLLETEKFYKSLLDQAKEPTFVQQTTTAYAYALVGLNKYNEAEAAIKNNNKPLVRTDPVFPFDKLTRARISLQQKKYRAALDQCAQLLAYFRINEPWYPEAQYVLAESYSGLSEELKKTSALDAENYDAAGQSIYAALYSFSPKSKWTKLTEKKLREKPQLKKNKDGSKPSDNNTDQNAEPKEEMPFSDLPSTEEKPKDEMQ